MTLLFMLRGMRYARQPRYINMATFIDVPQGNGVDSSAAICHLRLHVGAGAMLLKVFTSPGAKPIVDIVTQ